MWGPEANPLPPISVQILFRNAPPLPTPQNARSSPSSSLFPRNDRSISSLAYPIPDNHASPPNIMHHHQHQRFPVHPQPKHQPCRQSRRQRQHLPAQPPNLPIPPTLLILSHADKGRARFRPLRGGWFSQGNGLAMGRCKRAVALGDNVGPGQEEVSMSVEEDGWLAAAGTSVVLEEYTLVMTPAPSPISHFLRVQPHLDCFPLRF